MRTDTPARLYRQRFLFAVSAVYIAIFASVALFGWTRVWSSIGVRPMAQSFGDIRAFTSAHVARTRGLDPLVDNPGDPWGRPANAPRIWIAAAAALQLTERGTNVVGGVLFLAFLASLAVLSRLIRSASDATLMALYSVSPAALFSIERGKIDSIVLLIVCAAIVTRRPLHRVGALLVAAILKLFPVFGLATAMAGDRRTRGAAAAAMLIFCVYAVATRDDLRHMQENIPLTPFGTYGVSPLANGIFHILHGRATHVAAAAMAAALTLFSLALGAIAGMVFASDAADHCADQEEACAIAGAVYIGSFVFIMNYDYRLVFMLPAIPLFNAARQSSVRAVARFGVLGLVGLGLAMAETPLTQILGRDGTVANVMGKLVLLSIATAGLTAYVVRRTPPRAVIAAWGRFAAARRPGRS